MSSCTPTEARNGATESSINENSGEESTAVSLQQTQLAGAYQCRFSKAGRGGDEGEFAALLQLWLSCLMRWGWG
ncbi:MAG: hypothetical protein GY943_32765 [Chloroflexi bacterium]|nr:hypothetical protein [Chloroflexota bacterium]